MHCKTVLLQHLLLPRLPFLLLHVTGPMLKMKCFCKLQSKKNANYFFSSKLGFRCQLRFKRKEPSKNTEKVKRNAFKFLITVFVLVDHSECSLNVEINVSCNCQNLLPNDLTI